MQFDFNAVKTGYSNFIAKEDLSKMEISEELSLLVKESLSNIKMYDNWYKYQNDLYYLKYPQYLRNFLIELIGVEISNYMEIPTIEYSIVSHNDNVIGLLSKNFKKEDKVYKKSFDLDKYEVRSIDRMLYNPKDTSLDKKYFTLCFFRNFFTSLHDRAANSIVIDNLDGTFSLPELYDYELEFGNVHEIVYNDPIYLIGTWHRPLNKELPELKECNVFVNEALDKLENLDILDIIKYVEHKHQINVPHKEKEYFFSYVNERKKVLKNIGILK